MVDGLNCNNDKEQFDFKIIRLDWQVHIFMHSKCFARQPGSSLGQVEINDRCLMSILPSNSSGTHLLDFVECGVSRFKFLTKYFR